MKASLPTDLSPKFPPIYQETINAAIRQVAYDSVLTMRMIAPEWGLKEPTAYHRCEEPEKISVREFIALARLACANGDTSLVDLLLPSTHTVVPLGDMEGESIESQVTELVEDAGRTIGNLKGGKPVRAEADARELLSDAQAIVKSVSGRRKR